MPIADILIRTQNDGEGVIASLACEEHKLLDRVVGYICDPHAVDASTHAGVVGLSSMSFSNGMLDALNQEKRKEMDNSTWVPVGVSVYGSGTSTSDFACTGSLSNCGDGWARHLRTADIATQSFKIHEPCQATLSSFEYCGMRSRPIPGATRVLSHTNRQEPPILYNVEWQHAITITLVDNDRFVISNGPRELSSVFHFEHVKSILSLTLPKVMRGTQLHGRNVAESLGPYTGILQS
eukprot:scaffold663113_cov60-Prasinocladus_malaysianus.AAC.1